MATVTCNPTSPVAVVDACEIAVASGDSNDASAWDEDLYPSMPELRYYLEATASGEDALRSHVFSPDHLGNHVWHNVVFPVAGSWTVALRDESDDSSVASVGVTVS